jgi:hypothetical protein
MRPDFLARRRVNTRWAHRYKRARILSIFVREISEQLILIGKGENPRLFLERIVGFCDTDLGLGMVVETLRGSDGSLAPSLTAILNDRAFDAAAERDLDCFLAAVLASNITLGGLNPGNILYAVHPEGGQRFVLIDGFGEGALVPLRGMFRVLNRRSKRAQIQRLQQWVARRRSQVQP